MTETIDPLDKEKKAMENLAGAIDLFLNGTEPPEEENAVGFILFTFRFGDAGKGLLNYITNVEPDVVLNALNEYFIKREKAGV